LWRPCESTQSVRIDDLKIFGFDPDRIEVRFFSKDVGRGLRQDAQEASRWPRGVRVLQFGKLFRGTSRIRFVSAIRRPDRHCYVRREGYRSAEPYPPLSWTHLGGGPLASGKHVPRNGRILDTEAAGDVRLHATGLRPVPRPPKTTEPNAEPAARRARRSVRKSSCRRSSGEPT
jgi:hypothetical protein